MLGPIGDALQLAWGLVYWNVRKTAFRAHRDRTPCPCQTPSDSGRGGETGCEPALLLNQPGRFRHVCPLLKRGADGHWRCSVDTADVRPFWGRAALVATTLVVAIYASSTLAAWGWLRHRGYPLSYIAVAWPPKWSEFHVAQSHVFAERASRALERRDIADAVMSLAVSYRLDPANYNTGRLLAQLTQVGQPGLADQTYAQLLRDHPDRAAETLAGWQEALLWRADFRGLAAVAREGLKRDAAHEAAWLHSLIFALRHAPDDAVLSELARSGSPGVRFVAALELRTHADADSARAALLAPPASDASSYLDYYRPKRLIELGFGADALALLLHSRLPMRDLLSLRFDALASSDRTVVLENEMGALLGSSRSPAALELIAAQLVRHPDPAALARVFEAVNANPLPADAAGYRAWAGLLCAAGASGDFGRLRDAGREMKRISGSEFRVLPQVEAFFRGEAASQRIESYLSAMQPLPTEVTFALLERYHRPVGLVAAKR